jgi:hypothetical protein
MRLLLPILAIVSTFAFSEDAPGVDLNKVPEVASVLKDMEKASTEARIKEIQKATRKLEPLVKKLSQKDVKLAAEVAHKIDDLVKEAKELAEGLTEKPNEIKIVGEWKVVKPKWNAVVTVRENKTFSASTGQTGEWKKTSDGFMIWDAGHPERWTKFIVSDNENFKGDSWDAGKDTTVSRLK